MKKGITLLFICVFALPLMVLSQTLEQREVITQNYDQEKLAELAEEYTREFNERRQYALEMAAVKGWEVQKELPNGGIALLVDVYENGNPKYYITENREGGITTRTDKVHTGGGAGLDLNGENMVLGVWDGGLVRTEHPLLENRVTQMDGATTYSNHATHVSGTLIGTEDIIGGAGKGMAPEATLDAYDFAADTGEIVNAAAAGMLVSNHSYGSDISFLDLWQLGFYDGNARGVDNTIYNAPYYLSVWSAGNDRQSGANTGDGGYDYLTDRGNAKNNIVVAATFEVLNYTGPSSVNMSSFSSWGPTDDGRIKPDISGKGVNMYSSVGASGYANYSGTSMSSPNVAGSLILLQQHYNNVNGNFMLASTLRGLALHTADEAGTSPGPDYRFGWGLLNIEKAAEVISNNGSESVVYEGELFPGDVYTFTVQADGVNDLMASITWTDKPGDSPTPGIEDDPTPVLVNDLDIRVSQDGGDTFFPWKLDPANPSAPATTGDNIVDNIEKVEVAGASGEYIIRVSHKLPSLVDGSQVFSMVVSGIDKEQFTVSSTQGILDACPDQGNASFEIDLDFNDGFSDTVNFSVSGLPAGATGTFTPSSLSTEGSVTLTVDGISGLAEGDYEFMVTAEGSSETVNLYLILRIVGETVADVDLVSPADGSVDIPIVQLIEWTLGDENVTDYTYQLARTEDFEQIQFNGNVSFPEALILGLTEGATYWWRVRPNTACNDGEWSEVWTFTVDGILGTSEQEIEGLAVYPNPTRDILNVQAPTEISSVEVLNVLGQVLIEKSTASSTVDLNMSGFSAGNYFVRIKTDKAIEVVHVIKE